MILADTSAWVEFDRRTQSPVHLRMCELIESRALAVTEPVEMELLANIRSRDRADLARAAFASCDLLAFRTPDDFTGAAHIYRLCRRAGITPRGMLDCMIAAVALRTGTKLLTVDKDLELIAEVIGLELDL